jgi:hypothetical protein
MPLAALPGLKIHHVSISVPDLQGRLAELVKRSVDIAAVQRHPAEPMAKDPDPLAPGKPRPSRHLSATRAGRS